MSALFKNKELWVYRVKKYCEGLDRKSVIAFIVVLVILGFVLLFTNHITHIPKINPLPPNTVTATVTEPSKEEEDPQVRGLDEALEGMVYRKDVHTGLCFGGFNAMSSDGLIVVVPCDKVEAAFLSK